MTGRKQRRAANRKAAKEAKRRAPDPALPVGFVDELAQFTPPPTRAPNNPLQSALDRLRIAQAVAKRYGISGFASGGVVAPDPLLPAEFVFPTGPDPIAATSFFDKFSRAPGSVGGDSVWTDNPVTLWDSFRVPDFGLRDDLYIPDMDREAPDVTQHLPPAGDLTPPLYIEYILLWQLDHPAESERKYQFEVSELHSRLLGLTEVPDDNKPLALLMPERFRTQWIADNLSMVDVSVAVRRLVARKWAVAELTQRKVQKIRITSAGQGALGLVDRLQDLDVCLKLIAEEDARRNK